MRGERSRVPIRDMKREHAAYGSGPVNSYKMSPEELEDYRSRNAYTAPKNSSGIKEKVGMDLRTKPKQTTKVVAVTWPKVVSVTEKKESAKVAHIVKEGPDKEFVLTRIAAGKSISSIERELAMKTNALHYWIRKWDWVGITPGKARSILGGQPIEEVIKLEEVKPEVDHPEHEKVILQLRNNILSYEKQIARWVQTDAENRFRITELTEDCVQWKELYCRVVQEKCEARQAVAELQEERQLLATIEGSVTQGIDTGFDPATVNHPSHYTAGGIETIDFIVAKLTIDEFAGFCKGNVLKYVARANHKGGLEDLRKAKWYVDRLIDESAVSEN